MRNVASIYGYYILNYGGKNSIIFFISQNFVRKYILYFCVFESIIPFLLHILYDLTASNKSFFRENVVVGFLIKKLGIVLRTRLSRNASRNVQFY